MSKQTHRRPAGRKILFLSLRDPHVVSFPDSGRGKDGAKTTERGQIEDLMRKTVEVDGKKLPAFMLAEAPAPLYSSDLFDERVLKDRKGAWYLASADPAWMEARQKFIDAYNRRIAARLSVKDASAQAEVVKNLARLVSPAAEPPKAAPPKAAPVKPEPAKAEHPKGGAA